MDEVFHQMDAKPPRLPQPSKNSQPGNPKVPQLLERATPGATKWLNPRGQKRGPKNTKNGTQKWYQKSLPGGSLAIIIIRRCPFRGTVFWTPKMCSKACFSGPFSRDLNFIRNAQNFYEKSKNTSINPSIQKTLAFPILILLLLAMRLTWQPQAARCQSKNISCFLFCKRRRAKARVNFDEPITSQTVEEEGGGTIFC